MTATAGKPVLAVFGGTFDPPTLGHALTVQWLLWSGKAQQVLLVPSFKHALGKEPVATYEWRLGLCRAMSRDIDPDRDNARVMVSAVERSMQVEGTPVYTYDVLTHLQEIRPEEQIKLVVGADILTEADKWHRWEDIKNDFGLIVLGRQGYPPIPDTPLMPFSSSELRKRLREGGDWEHLVTPGIRRQLNDTSPYHSP